MKQTAYLTTLLLVGSLTACNMPVATAQPTLPVEIPTFTPQPCISSGDQRAIQMRLLGSGAIAVLCPGAVFELTGPVNFSAANQKVYTEGLPTDDTRATLRIVAQDQTTAVRMRDYDGAVLSNVIVDGNRTNLGPLDGDALVYAGGFSDGQVVRGNKLMDTRSWSTLQVIQGHSDSQPCQNAVVEDNEVGPAGTSDAMQWADGISFACTNSVVRNNTITDATDGAIVVFGAPGSVIEKNTIRAETRTLLGGINMVDYDPTAGNYAGTIVRDNVIDASGAVIRIGLGMGPRVWGCLPADSPQGTVSGGTVTGNVLRGDHMQYGFAVDGVRDWTVTGNIDEARHSGQPSVECGGRHASAPAGFQYDPAHAEGTFQPEFSEAYLDLALSAIVAPQPGHDLPPP